MSKFYGPYACSIFHKSIIDFVLGCLLEEKYPKVPLSASSYPQFLRTKSGIAELFVHFSFPQSLFPEEPSLQKYIFAISDVAYCAEGINDVLSFYKESVIGTERNNYVFTYARTHNITACAALEHRAQTTYEHLERIGKIFAEQDIEEKDSLEVLTVPQVVKYFIQGTYALKTLHPVTLV